MKQKIKNILEYLKDEEKNFWENCTCSEDVQKMENPRLCECEENKNHILRDIIDVGGWVDSSYCPLVDEGEL